MYRCAAPLVTIVGLGVATVALAASPQDILGSLTATSGLYSNRIPAFDFAQDYAEVCYVGGARLVDSHPAGGPTAGGNCLPGDTGFVIELRERTAATWDVAMETCIMEGMRLPEPVEFLIACRNAAALGSVDLNQDYEWSGNALQFEGTRAMFGAQACAQQVTATALQTYGFHCAR